MKKILSIVFSCVMLMMLGACGNGGGTDPESGAPSQTAPAQQETEPAAESASGNGNALVVYFSATGNTKAMAETVAEVTGADIFEIIAAEPYTDEDLDYSDDNCRANREMNDETARPAISGEIENIDEYDTIYLGYPIWWGTMPRIINTFIDTYDLTGKTIMPFCTSGGTGITASVSELRELCSGADVKDGLRGSASVSADEISEWISENGL